MKFRTIIEVEFRDFNRRVLEKTWEWLNDPEIRNLTQTTDFDRDSQEEWFKKLPDRKDYYIQSVWRDDEPIGVCGIKHITSTDGEVWGYIGEKQYWGKAIGIEMMQHLLDYAKSINLESVYAVMLKDNHYSYKINLRFGFVVEKELDEKNIVMRYNLPSTSDNDH